MNTDKQQNDKISFIDNKFIASLSRYESNHLNKNTNLEDVVRQEKLKQLYNDWLYNEANRIFAQKVNYYDKILGVKSNGVVVKNLRNRWGSLTKNDILHLNFNLIKAPEDVIDYVVIHELCHFKIKGHSYRFWDYLKLYVSDYEKKISWLERNTDSLMT
jgi:predicted metal-dependent hydrolase